MASLERGQWEKCVEVLKECLKKRQNVLQRYDKDVAETHDALARYLDLFLTSYITSYNLETIPVNITKLLNIDKTNFVFSFPPVQ
jgi:hypothetical protein